jgi:uncharacterized protein (DUF362 family)
VAFLRSTLLAGGGLALLGSRQTALGAPAPGAPGAVGASRVALIKGDNRMRNTLEALKAIEADVRPALEGKKRVLIKPNFVSTTVPLAATQADVVEGILAFLKPIYKGEIIIGETAAGSATEEGFRNFGYYDLAKKHPVRLVNFDLEPHEKMYVIDSKFRPRPIRVTHFVLDPDTYIISAARLKTHDRVVATLSLKNILVGSVIKSPEFRWGGRGKGWNDKPITHGDGIRGVNFNMFKMAEEWHPHLAVIDGFEGLQGNGPISGTPVDHRIAIASTDWLAADRTAVEVMGIDYAKVGYLNFCADAGLGQGDLAKLQILGEKPDDVKRTYRLHDNVEKQFEWG